MAFSLIKFFRNFGGITYRIPELVKDSTYATDMLNVRLSENFSLSKRRGFQTLGKEFGRLGVITYNNVNLGAGTLDTERLIMDEKLWKVVSDQLVITYTGAGPAPANPSISFTLDPNTSEFYFRYFENGTLIVNQEAGTGLEVAPFTLADLITVIQSINGGSDYTVTFTGDDTIPAAFIRSQAQTAFISDEATLTVDELVEVTAPGSFIPFSNSVSNISNDTWEINSSTQLNDVVYITNEYDGLIKYDGLNVYKAGLPNAPVPTLNNTPTTGAVEWEYRVLYTHIDDKENFTTSRISEPLEVLFSGTPAPDVRVNISNVTNQGYDTADSRFKIELFRTITGGTVFYKVDTKVVSDAVSDIITFSNTAITDSLLTLEEEFVFPINPITPPPNCRYIDVWRSQLALTGNPQAVNEAYISDLLEGIESFPPALSVTTGSRFGGANSGIRSLDNHLYVFKPNAINMISGDINAGATNIQIDTISDDGIGALSHSSIIEAQGALYFISRNGVYKLNTSGLIPTSDSLIPLFTRYTFKENRIVGFNWVVENKIMFLLPEISSTGVSPTSRVIVYDMVVDAWTIWNNLDFTAGISLDEQDVWFCGSSKYNEILDTRSVLDYADHSEPVSFVYKSHWETIDEPSIPKKFNRIKVYTLDTELQTFDSSIFSLNISTQHNYLDLDVSIVQMIFGAVGNTGYGDAPYGEFQYGNVKVLTDTKRLAAQKAQSLRTIFSNSNTHENVLISGFELEITAPYAPSIKDGR